MNRTRIAQFIASGNPGTRRFRIALKVWGAATAPRITWFGGMRD